MPGLRRRRRALDEAEQFAGAVRQACSRLGLVVLALDSEVVSLSGRIEGSVALTDVLAACRLQPVPQWPAVVAEALQGLARSLQSPVDVSDVEAVRPLLRARVLTEGAVLAEDVVCRPLADGLVEVLVVDVAGAVRNLPPAVARAWGLPLADLFDHARALVLADGPLARRTLDLGGVQVLALESTSAFAATHVAWLGALVDVPPAGMLVALPTRHLVLAAPMTTRSATVDAAQALLVNSDALWRAGPGALSPDLWWWRAGRLVLLPGSPTSLSPPMAFLEVLDALPG